MFRYWILISFFLGSFVLSAQEKKLLSIIPEPTEVVTSKGFFKLKHAETIYLEDFKLQKNVELFNVFLKSNYSLELLKGSKKNSKVHIALDPQLDKEDYHLMVTSNSIHIKGGEAGVFYALQTLGQIIEQQGDEILVPCCFIKDSPRFGYRGLMLDVGRYFYSVEYVKQFIDLMSLYKFNTFHWHLTEDQGWRIEIKSHPELTKKAAWRNSTQTHRDKTQDNVPHGGFYTQEQIREVVQYAGERYITVIPEIEMPGHARAALSVYPHLGCTGEKPTRNEWGVFPEIYCAGNDTVFAFLEDVLAEVIELFPSEYIHIGGDEAKKDIWKKCTKCQQRIKNEGLSNEKELQSYFIKRIETYLNSKGKNIIGWDEILEGGLAPNATVMSWRGEKGGIAAAQQGHQVIMSPYTYLYLDYYQAKDRSSEPYNHSGNLPLDSVYSYEPYTPSLLPSQHKYIKGIQGNLWGEYIHGENKAFYMLYPRALAAAEVAWSPAEKKNYECFSKRIKKHLLYLDRRGITFRIPEAQVTRRKQAEGYMVKLESLVENAKIYYTVDGNQPTTHGILYEEGILVDLVMKESFEIQYVVEIESGRQSGVYTLKIE